MKLISKPVKKLKGCDYGLNYEKVATTLQLVDHIYFFSRRFKKEKDLENAEKNDKK